MGDENKIIKNDNQNVIDDASQKLAEFLVAFIEERDSSNPEKIKNEKI